jgi:hypothetical protein
MSNAIYESVTARILECLNKGVVPWRKAWGVTAPRNLASQHVYRGINQILLSCTAFSSPYWVTFKQAKELGGSIKRGEHGTPIVFWRIFDDEDSDERRFVLRRFTVFNTEQTERLIAPKLAEPKAFETDQRSVMVAGELATCQPSIRSICRNVRHSVRCPSTTRHSFTNWFTRLVLLAAWRGRASLIHRRSPRMTTASRN